MGTHLTGGTLRDYLLLIHKMWQRNLTVFNFHYFCNYTGKIRGTKKKSGLLISCHFSNDRPVDHKLNVKTKLLLHIYCNIHHHGYVASHNTTKVQTQNWKSASALKV